MNNIKICIKCNDIPINKIIQEWNECYECCQDDRPFNMNRKDRGKCECLKIDINIFFCNNCKIQVYKCKDCLNYYEKNKFYYNSCIECLKNNNPSDNNNIYEWNDNNKSWKLIKIKKKCTICNINYYICEGKNNINEINICIQCQLQKLQKQFNNIEFNIINENISFKKKCICNNFTNWIDKYYLFSKHIIQCNNCNPSTDMLIYEWNELNKYWNINKIYKNCIKCNKKILCKINNFTSDITQCINCDIIQCINCNPSNNYIKFKFVNIGWNIDKIKIFNGNKHNWKNTNIKDINYKCNCIKCIK